MKNFSSNKNISGEFSPLFKAYFFKHFPQLRNKLTLDQQSNIQQFCFSIAQERQKCMFKPMEDIPSPFNPQESRSFDKNGYPLNEKSIHLFLEEIAGQKRSVQLIWEIIEQDTLLMDYLSLYVYEISGGKKKWLRSEIFLILNFVVLIAGIVLLIFFQEKVHGSILNMISVTLGILGACLRENLTHYFERSKETFVP